MLNFKDLEDRINFNQYCVVPKLFEVGADKLANNIKDCGDFSRIATCSYCGTKYYAGSSYCRSRFCAVCSRMRAMAWLSKLVPLLEKYKSEGYQVFMLNLTVKNHSDLKYVLEKLNKSWRIMTHDDKRCRKTFRHLNDGGVRSIEIKLGENSSLWHPHIHSIVLLKTDCNVRQYDDYREIWEYCSSLAFETISKVGSIDIRGLKGYDDDIINAVIETFKYMTKFDWLRIDNDKLLEFINVSKNKRFISSWGVLYGINKQVEELLNKTTEEELKEHTCVVCGCSEFELESILTDMIVGKKDIFDFEDDKEYL